MIFIANAPDFGTYVGTCMGSSLLLPNRYRGVFFRAIIMINNGCACLYVQCYMGIVCCVPLNQLKVVFSCAFP